MNALVRRSSDLNSSLDGYTTRSSHVEVFVGDMFVGGDGLWARCIRRPER